MLLRAFRRRVRQPAPASANDYLPAAKAFLDNDLLVQAAHLGRLGLIVGQPWRWQDHPEFKKVHQSALREIDEQFSMVPEGFAQISESLSENGDAPEKDHRTAPFLMARHPVTHAQYQMFVDGGGYQDLELWPESIWPHLIDFVDLTGNTGPRYWRHSRHNSHLANHPVVGISAFEAQAYARWAGYSLPTEAQWQMAATWCIRSAALTMRRYPWGDAFDLARCNIWSSGRGHTVPVGDYAGGAAPNGVNQLIGNVWEWTSSDFVLSDTEGRLVIGDALMKCIRGGAYDTYFPWQATSTFRTGLNCLLRSHNVGFRCALDIPEQPVPASD